MGGSVHDEINLGLENRTDLKKLHDIEEEVIINQIMITENF